MLRRSVQLSRQLLNQGNAQEWFTQQMCHSFAKPTSNAVPLELGQFNTVTVDLRQMPVDLSEKDFETGLKDHLSQSKADNKSACWLKVPMKQGKYLSVAGELGFHFHHAVDDHALLYLWLKDGEKDTIPGYATHQVGVAGFVMNEETGEVLVVQDRGRKYTHWKFPGGLSDPGEGIAETAVREVFEETGVKTEFKSILAFRQQLIHPNAFGRSDLYVISRLVPKTIELAPCEREIKACQWMHINQLLNHEGKLVSNFTKHICKLADYGFKEGFDKVDVSYTEMKSIHKGFRFKLFHRPGIKNENSDTALKV